MRTKFSSSFFNFRQFVKNIEELRKYLAEEKSII